MWDYLYSWAEATPVGQVVAAVQAMPGSALASAGVSASPEAYNFIESRYYTTPQTPAEAAELAIFWLRFAARRADFDNRKMAQQTLNAKATQFEAILAASPQFIRIYPPNVDLGYGVSYVTGFGSQAKTENFYLSSAAETIRSAGLSPVDVERIEGVLAPMEREILMRALGNKALAIGIGIAAGYALSYVLSRRS
jgi:hypothetical protein